MSWGVVYSYWVGVGGRGLKTVELGALQPPAWVLHNFLGHLSSRGRCKWKGSHEEWWLYIFSNQPGLKQRNKSDVKQTISKQKLKNDLTHLLEDPDFVHVEDPIHSSGFDGMQHPRRLSSPSRGHFHGGCTNLAAVSIRWEQVQKSWKRST